MKLNGDRLRSLRAQTCPSQGDLAKMSDVHPKTIYRAENGSPVDQETAAFIADALGVPAKSLRNEDAPAHWTRPERRSTCLAVQAGVSSRR